MCEGRTEGESGHFGSDKKFFSIYEREQRRMGICISRWVHKMEGGLRWKERKITIGDRKEINCREGLKNKVRV